MTTSRRINWDDVPLGRYSDGELARRLMTTRQAVSFQRNARGIPPLKERAASPSALTTFERDDLEALDEAVEMLTRADREQLTFKVWSRISLVRDWQAETRHARSSCDGEGGEREGRATAFRFQMPGSRQWTAWLEPRAARMWLLEHGWADEAKRCVDELRARARATAPNDDSARRPHDTGGTP